MDKLTEYFEAERGRKVRLARSLGLTPGAVSQWEQVPADKAADVSRLTGIPVEELRPDVFRVSSVETAE